MKAVADVLKFLALAVVCLGVLAAEWCREMWLFSTLRAADQQASWYGEGYRGKAMANGQPFNPDAMTCAGWAWPLGTMLRVTSVDTGRSVVVEVTDRGPAAWTGCQLDLSRAAFARIQDLNAGRIRVRVAVLSAPQEVRDE